MGEVLKIENLCVGYKDIVVHNVCVCAFAGETIGIIGLNGSGKSTLLGGISGVAKVFSGDVFVNGINQNRLSIKKRAKFISKYSQRTSIATGLLAWQIIEMGLYAEDNLLKSTSSQKAQKVLLYAKMFGIEHLLQTECQKLSEGQRSLVFLAKTAAQNTHVVLLDEPDSSLDYINTHKLFSIMSNLIKTQKKVGVFVLHDPTLALNWCDKILILHEGVIKDLIETQKDDAFSCQKKLSIIYPDILVLQEDAQFYCRFKK